MVKRILVPIDGSSVAERGLAHALELAVELKAMPHLVLLHVLEPPLPVTEAGLGGGWSELSRALRDQGEALLARAKGLCEAAGVGAETDLREAAGRVADVVVERVRQRDCDLVVMGTHGRRGANRWVMGSDAEIVARHSPVPVLLVREPRPGE